jgi:hypothetical protein
VASCFPVLSREKLNAEKSMGMSSFAQYPQKQGSVQGRFKPTHHPITPSTKVKAYVRRFETPNALSDGRA